MRRGCVRVRSSGQTLGAANLKLSRVKASKVSLFGKSFIFTVGDKNAFP